MVQVSPRPGATTAAPVAVVAVPAPVAPPDAPVAAQVAPEPAADSPVRIEFFGDTVDSIRQFDAETQLSTGQLKEISIAPMREFAATAKDFKDWAFFAREGITFKKRACTPANRTAPTLPAGASGGRAPGKDAAGEVVAVWAP